MIVVNDGDYIVNGAGIRLVPGTNNVPSAAWKAFIEVPLNRALVDSGELIPQEDAEGNEKSLAEMSKSQIAKLVKDTHDVKVLNDLRDQETAGRNRPEILDVIEKGIAAVEAELKKAQG